MPHQPHPRLLEQVLGGVALPREAQQEGEETAVPGGVHEVEGRRISGPQARHDGQLLVSIHGD